jgi:carboxymethylenebutenolidase
MLTVDQKLDFDALLPVAAQAGSRRSALKLALGAGYAVAAGPLMAQTAIKTSSEGLRTGESSFEVNGFKVPVFFAAPAGKTNLPVVLVIHEVFGVHEYIADTCRRLARAGYLAVAPELFARLGDPGEYGELGKLMAEIVNKTSDTQVMTDLDGAVAWAAGQGGDAQKVAITGFCWGGRITWLYAQYSTRVKAGVAWYGRLVGQPSATSPQHPLQQAASLKAPVLGLYGGQDTGIPLDTVEQMKTALAGAGAAGNAAARASEFVIYPDSPHAFHADYRPTYRAGPAQDGFKRALEWFKAKGVA